MRSSNLETVNSATVPLSKAPNAAKRSECTVCPPVRLHCIFVMVIDESVIWYLTLDVVSLVQGAVERSL
jgi:hypothetical protein